MRTHYQSLKVPETASERDIRSAFRRLCHQYHPDKAPGNAEALRIMQIINDAYEVLSDPVRRAEYDQRLRVRRRMPSTVSRSATGGRQYQPGPRPGAGPGRAPGPPYGAQNPAWQAPRRGPVRRSSYVPPATRGYSWRGILFVIWLGFMISRVVNFDYPGTSTVPLDLSSFAEGSDTAVLARSGIGEVPATPKGLTEPAYLPNYPVLFNTDLSSLTIDNSAHGEDVRLELMKGTSVSRVCFVPANSEFTLSHLSPGTYHVRYWHLTTGREFKTPDFKVDQAVVSEGVRFNKDALVLTRDGHRLNRRPRFERRGQRP